MECSNPKGCPDPLECSGDGCCHAGDSFECCSSMMGNPESLVATSATFSEPLELTVNRLEAQIVELFGHIDRLERKD